MLRASHANWRWRRVWKTNRAMKRLAVKRLIWDMVGVLGMGWVGSLKKGQLWEWG